MFPSQDVHVTYENCPEPMRNLDPESGNRHDFPISNTAPRQDGYFRPNANGGVDQTALTETMFNENNAPSLLQSHSIRVVDEAATSPASNVYELERNEHVIQRQNTALVSRAQPYVPDRGNNVDNVERNHHHVTPNEMYASVAQAAPGMRKQRGHMFVEGRNCRNVSPNRNSAPVTQGTPYVLERGTILGQAPRNQHNVFHPNVVPVRRPGDQSRGADHTVDDAARNQHTVSSPDSTPDSRAGSGHVTAVNCSSFFISLPLGRKR